MSKKLRRFGIQKYEIYEPIENVFQLVILPKNIQIFTTLPSNADFEAYIKGFPKMQVNLICESHGYYVIDILESSYNMAAPLPESVYEYMRKLRSQPFMRIGAFSDDGIEYFATTLKNWKTYINEQVNKDMMKLFGISIRYYGYSDEPPIVTFLIWIISIYRIFQLIHFIPSPMTLRRILIHFTHLLCFFYRFCET